MLGSSHAVKSRMKFGRNFVRVLTAEIRALSARPLAPKDRKIIENARSPVRDFTAALHMQWMFNKSGGQHIQLVVSASRSLTEMARPDVIDLALRELKEFFPLAKDAKLERAHVVKEVRATFSAAPGLEACRPKNRTNTSNLFLAGDWAQCAAGIWRPRLCSRLSPSRNSSC